MLCFCFTGRETSVSSGSAQHLPEPRLAPLCAPPPSSSRPSPPLHVSSLPLVILLRSPPCPHPRFGRSLRSRASAARASTLHSGSFRTSKSWAPSSPPKTGARARARAGGRAGGHAVVRQALLKIGEGSLRVISGKRVSSVHDEKSPCDSTRSRARSLRVSMHSC